MIAIYPVRPGDDNPELVFSLRSLVNAPQITEVWTVGHCPAWLQPDRHIDGNHHNTGQANVYNNIRLACHAAGHEQVAILNDDFYVTELVDELPTAYRSTLDEHLDLPRVKRHAGQWWPTSLETTKICLQAHGIKTPLSYELHIPFICDAHLMANTLELFRHVTPDNPPQWRSLYGNLHRIGGEPRNDGKAYGPGTLNRPFHSTEDQSVRYFTDQLTAEFPNSSAYEKSPIHARA